MSTPLWFPEHSNVLLYSANYLCIMLLYSFFVMILKSHRQLCVLVCVLHARTDIHICCTFTLSDHKQGIQDKHHVLQSVPSEGIVAMVYTVSPVVVGSWEAPCVAGTLLLFKFHPTRCS